MFEPFFPPGARGLELTSMLPRMRPGLRPVISTSDPLPVPSLHSPKALDLPSLPHRRDRPSGRAGGALVFFSRHGKRKVKETELSNPEDRPYAGQGKALSILPLISRDRKRQREEAHPEVLHRSMTQSRVLLDPFFFFFAF